MKNKALLLVLLFMIIPSCFDPNFLGCNCPPLLGSYFDVNGLELEHRQKSGERRSIAIAENDQITFDQYYALFLLFSIDYISQKYEHKKRGFSLTNRAFACSCFENGELGSKTERLLAVTIITLNDFDQDHLANDTLNNQFTLARYDGEFELDRFVEEHSNELMEFPGMKLKLKKAPELNNELKIRVIVELSSGETYDMNAPVITISN